MRIAIVGAATANKMAAPYDDPAWTVWALSVKNHCNPIPRWDAWFELHKPGQSVGPDGEPLGRDPWSIPDYVAFLKRQRRVYVRGEYGLPGEVQYPEAEMRARFGPFFFTSTVAHMAALAIASIEADREAHGLRAPIRSGRACTSLAELPEDADAIGFYGVLMAAREEYEYQRPGCQHFIQCAWDRGIDVIAPPPSRLFDPPEDRW